MPQGPRWILSVPQEGLASASDRFAVAGFQVVLHGSLLELQPDAPRDEALTREASRIVDIYVDALRTHLSSVRLRRADEPDPLASITPRVVQPTVRRIDDRLISRAIRAARGAVLGAKAPRLSKAYDYYQDAREDGQHSISALYKLVETIEGEWGGKKKTDKHFRMVTERELIRRFANDPTWDERHAPTGPGPAKALSESERKRAMKSAHKLLRAYEHHVWTSRQL